MNNSLNKVCLLGNLGKEVEVRSMSNGGEVVSFSVATSESWKDKSGVWTDKTEWHKVIIFNEHLIKTAKKLSKGNKVYIEGQLQTRKWTDQSGTDKYTTEIVLQKYDGRLIPTEKLVSGGVDYQQQQGVQDDDMDDEIPFQD